MSTIRRLVSVALDMLGDTADDVADVLSAGGWTGLRNDPCACPVAVYLRAVLPQTAAVAVSVNGISVTTDDERMHDSTPPGPAEFIARFDDGDYDELAAVVTDSAGDPLDDLDR